ncbi:MAG: phosphoenolpyruvate--protein phosphotransferase [Bacillota bacterium]
MHGKGVSKGISIGTVSIKKNFEQKIVKRRVKNIEYEIDKYKESLAKCKDEINEIYKHIQKEIGKKEADEYYKHIEILKDSEIIEQVIREIKGRKINAEFALKSVINNYINIFENLDDPNMENRIEDLKDILNRTLKIMINFDEEEDKKCGIRKIIVAKNLRPSDTAKLDLECVIGIVSEVGGETSHSAIMAKALGVPAVTGIEGIVDKVDDGDTIILDGIDGEVIKNPSDEEIHKYLIKQDRFIARKKKLERYKTKPTVTKDGYAVELSANIATLDDLDGVLESGCEGIGLFRTEFIYMNKEKVPTEQEQFEIYKKVAQKMGDKPVVIRTLDIGGDKNVDYLDFPEEINPFLGYRAIRMSLDQPDIFKTQLRAILRASVYGNLKIMFPLICHYSELIKAKNILENVKKDLALQGIKYDKDIEVGMMMEVPSAVLISDDLAKEVDFFSIGTNDLIQYTLAVDRMSEHLSYLFTAYHPGVLQLIAKTIKSAHDNNIWVGVCGEVAGNEALLPLLVSMGIDEFSMNSNEILKSRYVIDHLNKGKYSENIDEILSLRSSTYVRQRLKTINQRHGCAYKDLE